MSGSKRIRKNKYKKKPLKERFFVKLRLGLLLQCGAGLFFLTALSLMLVFTHDFLTQWDYLNARNIHVEGQRRLFRETILSQAQIGPSDNILAINLSMARARLLSHPWIAEADIRREFPATIVIRISEHRPLAVIDLGRELLMDEEGEIFKEKTEDDPVDLPVVTGLDYAELDPVGRSKSKGLKAVVDILRVIKTHYRGIGRFPVDHIGIDRDLGLTLTMEGPVKSVFIGYEDYESKYRKIQEVIDLIRTTEQFSDIEAMDISNVNRVVIRPSVMLSSSGNEKGGSLCKDKT
ncbi:MAG: cell division protein FtsQ/DivIB [Thermodesulfobacteriota bacterium]